jgi:16S rRNA (cytosine967-C5)-methyltransferase
MTGSSPFPFQPRQSLMTANSRQLALEALIEWEHGQFFALDIIDRLAKARGLDHRDTALMQTLVLCVLRNMTLLDHMLDQVCDNKRLERHVHWLLRLGAAQLLLLEMPPHAAVNETVSLAQKARGLVNAVLRRIEREKASLLAQIPTLPPEDRFSQPDWLIERWTKQYGSASATTLCEWNQTQAPTFVRLNQLQPAPDTIPETFEAMPSAPVGFYKVEQPPRDLLASGQCYVQDPSTAIACELLAPRPGDSVLDACAAPGGKTAYLAQLMQNQGTIVACDSSARRADRLKSNLKRMNVQIAQACTHDWTAESQPTTWQGGQFDRILVDVPCSNTGVMRRRVDVRWRLQPWSFRELIPLQQKILTATLALLKPGGSLVYSTCSLDGEENEGVVQSVLATMPGYAQTEQRESLPWRDGFDGAYAAKIVRNA